MYILIQDSVFVFLGLRGLFTYLFEQDLFSSFEVRPDLIEARKVMADVLLKWRSLSHRVYNMLSRLHSGHRHLWTRTHLKN